MLGGSARRSRVAAAVRRGATGRRASQHAADEHHRHRDQLRLRQPERRRRRCGAGTRPGSAPGPRRSGRSRSACPAASGRASATAAARTPPITMRLVDRRRVDGRRRRHRAVRDRPSPTARPSSCRSRRRRRAGSRSARSRRPRPARGRRCRRSCRSSSPRYFAQAEHGERAADQPAVEHQPGAAEQRAAVLGDVPELRADDPADQRGEDHLVGEVDVAAELLRGAWRRASRRPGTPGPGRARRSGSSGRRCGARAALEVRRELPWAISFERRSPTTGRFIGFTTAPLMRVSKCRWSPKQRPVQPT